MMKLAFTADLVLISALLLSALSVQSMENIKEKPKSKTQKKWSLSWKEKKPSKKNSNSVLNTMLSQENTEDQKIALEFEEYNQKNLLVSQEVWIQIFYHSCIEYITAEQNHPQKRAMYDLAESLEKTIKNFMRVSLTCKKFNQLLTYETIGSLCKNIATQESTDNVLLKLAQSILPSDAKTNFSQPLSLPLSMVVCAGANPDNISLDLNTPLIEMAFLKKDKRLVTSLLKHHAYDPNSLFRYINTQDMLQIVIDSNANKDANNTYDALNILPHLMQAQVPAELISLALREKILGRFLDCYDSCLLHNIAEYEHVESVDDFLKKSTIILNAIPDMINTINKQNRTPVDATLRTLSYAKTHKMPQASKAHKQLIILYKKRGGLTAEKLAQKSYNNKENDLDK